MNILQGVKVNLELGKKTRFLQEQIQNHFKSIDH